ncbi:MAG: hypothetical protein D6815_06770 [Candidatus Dadabacteria bacterium]|nr:MAG: hypothetical protein D6815_06770 [Candidatus Dadabacteria bacterium]
MGRLTRWLGAAGTLALWAALLSTRNTLEAFTHPLGILAILTCAILTVSLAAEGRPLLQADVWVTVVVLELCLIAGTWLDFRYLHQAEGLRSACFNFGLAVTAVVLVIAGTRLVTELHDRQSLRCRIRRISEHSAWRIAMWATAIAGTLLLAEFVRVDAAARETRESDTCENAASVSWRAEEQASLRQPARNVILISIDTLRADHVGAYGYPLPTTPHIDQFFSSGTVFENAYAQAPWTLPSHMTMITGQHVSTHGARIYPVTAFGYVDRLPDEATTIAEILRDHGLKTAAFTMGGYVGRAWGFDQGFETFRETSSWRIGEALDYALPWLETHHQKPFFLFVHGLDPHRYDPPRTFKDIPAPRYGGPLSAIRRRDPQYLERLVSGDGLDAPAKSDLEYLEYLYDSEVRNADEELGRLFAAIERLGLTSDTAVILTSDHGESFAEHGTTGHAFNLYDPVLRVPMLIRVAGSPAPPPHVATRVQLVDLAPTIIDLLGLPQSATRGMQGRSLLPLLSGAAIPDCPIIVEADALDTQAALILDGYKYVHYGILSHNPLNPRFVLLTLKGALSPYVRDEELFDLRADPAERHNLAALRPDIARKYKGLLFSRIRLLRLLHDNRFHRKPAPMPESARRQLRALGYLD